MTHRVQIARAWCDEHLAQCWHAYDESTMANEHLGESNAEKWRKLTVTGYHVAHRGGVYTFTLWKAQPLALPLDWQMARESKEPEYIEIEQDW